MNQYKKTNSKNNNAFTLVELIVSITILSILGTIAFISLSGYAKGSRNSVRVTDLSTIKQALGIHKTSRGKYPLASNYTSISYSGGILWNQGTFGENTIKNINTLSKITLDPLYNIEYDYSVTDNAMQYQIATIMETALFASTPLINQANALSNSEVELYMAGDYLTYDVATKVNGNCFLITAPSLFVNNYTATGKLIPFGYYNFIYNDGINISENYQSNIDISVPGKSFQINEVFNKCTINSVDELNLYISKLSIAYQQLNGNDNYNDVIYNYNNIIIKEDAIKNLIRNGISISKALIKIIKEGNGSNIFKDTFSEINGTEVMSGYSSDSLGTWAKTGALVGGSYILSSNKLKKVGGLTGVLFPIPSLPITSQDIGISFKIKDFGGGTITLYSHYIDPNNYYGVELSSTGYTLIHKVAGVNNPAYPIPKTDPIALDSQIDFVTLSDNIILTINNIEKENNVDATAIFNGKPGIDMANASSQIDDFTLIYR